MGTGKTDGGGGLKKVAGSPPGPDWSKRGNVHTEEAKEGAQGSKKFVNDGGKKKRVREELKATIRGTGWCERGRQNIQVKGGLLRK